MRLRIDLQYDGTDFFGWQIQPKEKSVQQTLQEVFTRINRNVPVDIVGCGRTDSGVHAHHYVAHLDFTYEGDLTHLRWKLNNMLPDSISILSIEQTYPTFHARFDATSRTYRYFIQQRKDPFTSTFSYLYYTHLDIDAMNEAAKHLLGAHDFTSFSKLHTDVKTNNCVVTEAFWIKEENQLVFQITANRFLRNMVRAVVGTLLLVGEGKIKPEEIVTILATKNRNAAGRSVPGNGLFLWEIGY
jgi:tRNA pseudouridine38-40 synthase